MGLLPPIVAELTAQNTELMAKVAESKAAMDDMSESGGSSFESLAAQGGVMAAAVGGALVAVGGIALDLGMKYQTATAQLAASADISIAKANAIGNAFLTTGGSSVFSAQQMMEAYTPVAAELSLLQGHALNASQALSLMKTASDLAEASGSSLSDATSDLATVMVAYHLSLSQANEASNVLFNTSRLTGQGLDSITQTFQRMHSQLGEVAPSLAQTGGLLVDLTAHGETGRQALSGVNSAMSTLLGSFKDGQTTVSAVSTELSNLGVSVFNSQGKFVGLDSIVGQLHDKFQGMSQQQQLAAASTLFGASAADKMLAVIDGGPAELQKYTDAVDKAGSAHDAAAKKSQTFEEQLKRLEVEAEDSGVRLGEWLIPKVETLTHDLIEGVTWIDHHRLALLALTPIVAYAGVAMGAAAIDGVEKLGTAFVDNAQSVVNFGAKMLGLDAPFAATQTEAEATGASLLATGDDATTMGGEVAAGAAEAKAALAGIGESAALGSGGISVTGAAGAAGTLTVDGAAAATAIEGAGLAAGGEMAASVESAALAGGAELGAGVESGAGTGAAELGAGLGVDAAAIGETMGGGLAIGFGPLAIGAVIGGVVTEAILHTSVGKHVTKDASTVLGTVFPATDPNATRSGPFGISPGPGMTNTAETDLANALKKDPAAHGSAQQEYQVLQLIHNDQAKTTDIKALQTNVTNMSTLFGKDSSEAQNARTQLLNAQLKFSGVAATDKNFSERVTALQTAENENAAKASALYAEKMALVAKDGTVADIKSGISDEKTVLHADIAAGNTQGAADAERAINTLGNHLSAIESVNAQQAKDVTQQKVDADILAGNVSTHNDVTSLTKKLDDVTISKFPAMQVKGSMLARVVS